jgi:plastocyanin
MADRKDNMLEENKQSAGQSTAIIVVIVALVIIGVVVYAVTRNNSDETTNSNTMTNVDDTTPTNATTNTNMPANNAPTNTAAVKEFNITGTNFAFSTKEIRVKQGDRVKINFISEGVHDWVVDEFNARTSVLQTGKSESIEFVASKTGTFEYYCSVGQHRQMGMKGNLIVE